MICDALSNAAYHVSLRGPGAELEGGSQYPPHQVVENVYVEPRVSSGRGLTSISKPFIAYYSHRRYSLMAQESNSGH